MEAIFNVIASALAVVAGVLSIIPLLKGPKRQKDDASRIPTSQTKPDESKDDDASRIPTNSAKLDEP